MPSRARASCSLVRPQTAPRVAWSLLWEVIEMRNQTLIVLLLVTATAASVACSSAPTSAVSGGTGGDGTGGDGTGGNGALEETVSCVPWQREPVVGTNAVAINNTWNEQWADGATHTQCLLSRESSAGKQLGFRWEWPEYKPYSSYAAPELLVGWKPWDGGSSTWTELPRRISELESLVVDFDVDLVADDTHNLNLTMWISATDEATQEKNISDIRNEVMVWFSNPAGLGGGIEYDGAVTLDGLDFEVWHLENQPDASAGTTHTWTMVIYILDGTRHREQFDLRHVLDDTIAKGLVDPEHAVDGVELVTEIFGGRGEIWYNRFDVALMPSR